MEGCDLGELVCLYLDTLPDRPTDAPAPESRTATGIGDALEAGESASARVELLGELQTLVDRGLVVAEERSVEGYDYSQTTYRLTDAGEAHARAVRERLCDRQVVVTNGIRRETPLSEVDRYLTDTETPLVTALARMTREGEVPLERRVADSFVGRTDELSTLRDAIQKSFTRGCRTVVVEGVSGVGKTTLVREAVEEVRADHEDLVFATGDSSPGATDAYGPFRAVAETIPDGGAIQDRIDDARAEVTPEDREEARAQRRSLFADVADELRTASKSAPIVVFLDNLQRADEATLQLFGYLADRVDDWGHPIAFVAAHRPPAVTAETDRHLSTTLSRIEGKETAQRIRLERLSVAETRAVLTEVLGHHEFPDGFVETVHERTGGNPLFLHETAVHLRESDRTDVERGQLPPGDGALELPETVTERIESRLANLDDPGRELVQLGAILGERVPGQVLATASDLSQSEYREYVDVLQASRIWEGVETTASPVDGEVADGSGDFRFVSGGLREAVVENLPSESVRRYHSVVADAFVEVWGEDVDRQAARVAHHYDRADRPEEALEYYRRAGDHARETYAHRDAVEHYERALEIARDLELESTVFDLLESVADVQFLVGEYDDASGKYREIQERSDSSSRERRAARRRADMYTTVGEAERGVEIVEAALSDWDEETDDPDVCRLLFEKGIALLKRGDVEEAYAVLEEALDMARSIEDDALIARALHNLSTVGVDDGENVDHLESRLLRQIEILDGTDQRRLRSKAYNNLAIARVRDGRLSAAREAFEECRDILAAIGDEMYLKIVRMNLGVIYQKRGDLEAARENYRTAMESAQRLGDKDSEGVCHVNMSEILRLTGDLEGSHDHLQRSLDLYRNIESEPNRIHVENRIAYLQYLRDELGPAAQRADRLVDEADGVTELERELALEILGDVRRERGDVEGAVEAHETAVDVADELGTNEKVVDSRRRLGATYLAADRPSDAREVLETARETVEEMADVWATLRVIRGHGRCKLRVGDAEGALADVQTSLQRARDFGGRLEECRALYALGEYHLVAGDEKRATELLEEGRSIASDAGAALIERQCRSLLRSGLPER